MSFLSWVFNLFLKIFAKPLLKYAPLVPERLRKMQALEKRFSKHSRLPKAARVEESSLNGVPALLIQKNRDYQKTEGIIFYLHGGGYCAGSPHAYKRLVWPLVKACDLPAIVIDYRQSPDHVFPAALDDSISAYRALLAQGYHADDIFIMGDSAGGNLTLSTLLKIKALNLPQPKSAVAISPWADLSNSGDSVRYNEKKDPYIPGFKQMDRAARLYAGATPLNDPLLSPVFADLSGLPPLKIIVGDLEVLLDDARRVAEKAQAAGVQVDYKAWKGQCHVFPLFAFFPEAKQCLSEIADFVNKHKSLNISLAA
jgi:epsilon-lactone hydrolase